MTLTGFRFYWSLLFSDLSVVGDEYSFPCSVVIFLRLVRYIYSITVVCFCSAVLLQYSYPPHNLQYFIICILSLNSVIFFPSLPLLLVRFSFSAMIFNFLFVFVIILHILMLIFSRSPFPASTRVNRIESEQIEHKMTNKETK